jgi:hypothetical protein
MCDRLVSVDWQYTPLQIIETERAYPNLWDAIDREMWQRRLIKNQLNPDKK